MMAFAVLAPFFAAAIAPILVKIFGHRAGWVLALVPAGIFVFLGEHIGAISEGETFVFSNPWVPQYGVNLSFFLDGLSLVFGLLISGIGAFILIYAGGYLKGHKHHGRFFSFLLLFMGSMLGLVLADNLITLFVFWELTSVTSFLLIGFDHKREAARRAAIQALVITGGGGLSLLAGFIMMSGAAGTFEMSEILAQGRMSEHPWYLVVLLLVLGGAFTKSAQVPFHAWLPNAMEAPTPVSAYLHSATMVKAGVYLLMRVQPILGDTVLWSTILPIFGGATLITGTLLGLRQTDLKLMLAYTTVASLGLLVMLTGTSDPIAIKGAVLYLVAHSLFKGCLFMVAGALDHESGTRDYTKLGGLRPLMPITFAAAILAALSMGGLPPFLGFVGKEVIYKGIAGADIAHLLVTATAVIGNAMMMAIGLAVALKPFLGKINDQMPKKAHEGPVALWLGPVILASLGLLAALIMHTSDHLFIGPMSNAVAGGVIEYEPHLIPSKIDAALGLSVLTIALGAFFFWRYEAMRRFSDGLFTAIGWGPDKGFDQAMRVVIGLAETVTKLFQTGNLRHYIVVTFATMSAVILLPLWGLDGLPNVTQLPQLSFYEWGIFLLALLGLFAVLVAATRLTAIISLGIQGFSVALIFLIFGAPDLAFTQFMVETLSVVILALVLTRLSLEEGDHRTIFRRLFDGGLAIVGAGALSLVLISVVSGTIDLSFSDFFTHYSTPVAHGRNIVNVILVDFRALDTMGEISVVMVAGLACLALIRHRARRPAGSAKSPAKVIGEAAE